MTLIPRRIRWARCRPTGFALRTGVAAIALVALQSAATGAQGLRYGAEIGVESRLFPRRPQFAGQTASTLSPSLILAPEFSYESNSGRWQLIGDAFLRLDRHDDNRTHIDVRELGLQFTGMRVTAFFGLGKVFWGVTEARHLVDIVNQTDAVEDLDGEEKLGQPMVSLTFEGGWGVLDVFYLPYFRELTAAAKNARLSGPFPVSSGAQYESDRRRWHPDFAARWSRPFEALDIGISAFRGTSREARFTAGTDVGGNVVLTPHYDIVEQLGLDLQWTGESTLLKFEGISRSGHGELITAITAGIEHTIYQPFSSSSDIGLLAELMIDSRDKSAPPTLFDNDLFLGTRWALNDVSDTSVLGGPVVDLATGEVMILIEAQRRLGVDWRVNVEIRMFANTDPGSIAYGLRRDGYASLSIKRFL